MVSKQKTILYIADDHPIVSKGFEEYFKNQFTQAKSFNNGELLIEEIKKEVPSHLILDINLPIISGLEVLQFIKESMLNINVVVFTMYNSPSLLEKCKYLGAKGYVIKTSSNSEIEKAFKTKGFYLGENVVEHIAPKNIIDAPPFITQREMEIIRFLAQDKGTKQIAEILNISEHTVLTHRKNLRFKLKVSTSSGIITYAYANGLIGI